MTSADIDRLLAESKAEYRQLGKSGLRISVPILGAMSLGDKRTLPWSLEEKEALPILKAAYDRGVNTWDTANTYSNGESERIIAKAIETYKIPREKVLILTKCSSYVGEEPELRAVYFREQLPKLKDYVNHGGLSRAAIFNQVNASLKRLNTDYIDLLQIHRYDKVTPIEETMEALNDLVRSGKVRYIGASSMWATEFAEMQFAAEKHGWTKFVSMQNQYSLLYREEEREMNRYCNKTGVGLIPWAPLCRGHLARPASQYGTTDRSAGEQKQSFFTSGTLDADKKIIQRVEELAEKRGWKMSEVALAWISKRVSSPIIGISTVERIDEALGARDKSLTDEEEKYLEELYQPRAIEGHF